MALRTLWVGAPALVALLSLQMVPDVSAAVTLGVFSSCVSDVSECLSLAVGQYPHCTDCSMFAKCDGAARAFMQCPAGLQYDYVRGVCEFTERAQCGTRRARTTIPVFGDCLADASDCVALSKAQGQYPLCSDCSGFVKCDGASSAGIPCPSGTEYDYILGVCNHIGTATCYE